MRIVYVTTAMNPDSFFSTKNKSSLTPLNPSGQNFHLKLIKTLSLTHEVIVISVRPITNSLTDKKVLEAKKEIVQGVQFNYIKVSKSKIYKYLFLKRNLKKTIKKLLTKDSLLICDTLNGNLSKVATSFKNVKKIGVVTDNPNNLSTIRKSFLINVLNSFPKYDHYFCLTESLNDLANPTHKPYLVFEGIIEDKNIQIMNSQFGKYFFFGGALYKRYGVNNLVDAFIELNRKDINLLVAGHGPEMSYIKNKSIENKNIIFLGLISNDEVIGLEKNAIANINPRPYQPKLDMYSVPSKTIEYMVSGRPTISGHHSVLKKKFAKEIIWLDSSSKDEIKEAMIKVLNMSDKDQIKLGESAKKAANSAYSLEKISDQIDYFLEANSLSIK